MGRRGIVVVHGLGEQPKGDTLNYIGRPLVEFVQSYLASTAELTKEVRFNPEAGPPRAILRFGQGADAEEWVIVEAWWARAFVPSPRDELLVWALILGFRGVWSISYGMALRHVLMHPWVSAIVGKRPAPEQTPWPDAPDTYWRRRRRVGSRLWDLLVGLCWTALLLAAYLASFPVLILLFVIGYLPVIGAPLSLLQVAFSNFLMHNLGDQHATTRNPLARDSTSTVILDALRPWVDKGWSTYAEVESVTIVAHSGGAVVAFDALTSTELRRWLDQGESSRPCITLYTLGSGINAAYAMDPQSALWDQRFHAQTRWVDLWAQYDPVPAGPPHSEIVRRSQCKEFVDLRVSNNDNPVDDHSTYFANQTEVLARILDGILRGPGARPAQLAEAVRANVDAISKHRTGVARRAGLRIVYTAFALGLAVLLDAHVRLGSGVAALVPSVGEVGWPLDALTSWVRGPAGLRAIGGLLLAVLLYCLWRLGDLFYAEWQRRHTRHSESV